MFSGSRKSSHHRESLSDNIMPLLTILGGGVALAAFGYGNFLALKRKPEPADPETITKEGGKSVTLSDGRLLVEYFVFGSDRSDATIVVEIAGSMHSASLFGDIPGHDEHCTVSNIRIIAITLPGFGFSSLNPGRRAKDFWKDVQPILEQESVNSFYVSGVSIGCANALAVANHFGTDRVLGIGLRAPYLDAKLAKELGLPVGVTSLPDNAALRWTWYCWILHLLLKSIQSATTNYNMLKRSLPKGFYDKHPDLSEAVIQSLLRAQKHNGYHGMLQVMASSTIAEWGFDPRDLVSFDKMVVWYGKDDENCPSVHAKWFVKYFEAKSKEFDGFGHLGASFLKHSEFISTLTEDNESIVFVGDVHQYSTRDNITFIGDVHHYGAIKKTTHTSQSRLN